MLFRSWLALQKYALCGTFNIGSGNGTTNMELADAIVSGFCSSSEIEVHRDKKEDTSVFYLDTEKAKNELGFVCRYSLTEAFRELSGQK